MTRPWWQGAVLYHVYVRSFFDSDGDGHGDLPGVEAKLDYIQSLGVDGIWLSPIHPSPNRDWGYDIADFDGVQADYGTLEDFQRLLDAAHARGLKVVLDEVLSHTSDEHPWFVESLTGGADGPKADWYVWADPQRGRDRAQQLALGVRRPGLGLPAGAAPALPPQVPAPAAEAELAQRRRARGGAVGARPLAGQGRRRLPARRRRHLPPRRGADRQPAGAGRRAHPLRLVPRRQPAAAPLRLQPAGERRDAGRHPPAGGGASANGATASCSASSPRRRSAAAPTSRPTEGLHSAYTFVLLLARKLTPEFITRPLRDPGRLPGPLADHQLLQPRRAAHGQPVRRRGRRRRSWPSCCSPCCSA